MDHLFFNLNNKLIDYILSIIGDYDITLDTDLYNMIDDLDSIQIIDDLESIFSIKISDEIAEMIFNDKNCTLNNLKKILKDNYNICDLKENRKIKISEINEKDYNSNRF